MRRHLVVLTIASVMSMGAWPREAAAAPTSEDEALAEDLFRDGKRLFGEGRISEACPKIAESNRLDPGGGTLLMLALCHEAAGTTASAWAEFTAAVALARRDGRSDRETIAREHADALLPRLRRLRVRVDPRAGPSVVVRRDGVVLGRPAWNVAAPVDPGVHAIEATAPGHEPYRTTVDVGVDGETVDVELPPSLLVDEAVADPHGGEREPERHTSPLRWAAYATAGVALVAGGAGAFLALDAKSKRDDANARCPDVACSDPGAVDLNRRAGARADLSTAAFVTGGILLGSAAVLYVLSIDRAPTPVRSALTF
jgi:hypothetical protein